MASAPSNAAFRAASFDASIGVNTHIEWGGGYSWSNWSNIETELSYTGIKNVRDSIPYANYTLSEYKRLAAAGIKFDIITSGPDVNFATDLQSIDALAASNPGSVASIEGTNEFNVNQDTLSGQSSFNNPSWGAGLDAALGKAVAADPDLAGTTVVAASLANAGQAEIAQQGDLSASVGASNWHVYYSNGEQPAANIASGIASARQTAPGRPVYLTESGYYTAVDAMEWGGGVNQDAQAKMTVNLLLDAYKGGAAKTFVYSLMDNIANASSSDLEDSFGLFNGDGTPKPAATALHNLTSILSDKGAGASTFTTGSLRYSLTGTTAQDNSLLLEKSTGTFDLALWNEQPIWNDATRTEIAATSHTITVSFGQVASYKLLDVLTGATVSQGSNTGSTDVSISDRPVILEVTPTAGQAFTTSAGQPVVCFATGTRIRVDRGDIAVERLRIGDVAVTAGGEALPIRWIGSRTIRPCRYGRPSDAHPVRIRADALAPGRPTRDLLVSPGHAICLNVVTEILVPAIALVNGASIVQEQVESITYWHVELDRHEILLAEGVRAESYLAMGNRAFFSQASGRDDASNGVLEFAVSPDGYGAAYTHADFCRPFHSDGPAVIAVREQLRQRAARLDQQPRISSSPALPWHRAAV